MTLSEWDIIDGLVQGSSKPPHRLGLFQSIGDDAAIFGNPREAKKWAITQDLLVEGVHFRLDWIGPEDLAYKAIAVNLSDLAAMAAEPRFLLLGLSIPPHVSTAFIRSFSKAFLGTCRREHLSLIGGDTCKGKRSLVIQVTAIGTISLRHALLKRGARTGDSLYVSGPLGASALGLACLRRGVKSPLIRRHLRPPIRSRFAQGLGRHRFASSMTDISDGLLLDLEELCGQDLDAKLDFDRLPIDRESKRLAARLGLDPTPFLLGGGEDYELLFTIPARKHTDFLRWCSKHRHKVFRIGKMIRRKGRQLSFAHFKKGYEAEF